MLEISQIMDRLGVMEGKLDYLTVIMDGDDTPANGMIVRMDRLEQRQLKADQSRVSIWTAIAGLGIAITGSLAGVLFGIWLHYK